MHLYIQDPLDPKAPFLHEKILEACAGASRGGGAFAFVTCGGVDLLLKDKVFQAFATKGKFQLVVGIDSITNPRALSSLQELALQTPNLNIRAFFHAVPKATFHPKLCWFRRKKSLVIINGSGNLTAKGMRGNWEAFTIAEVKADLATALQEQWESWIQLHAGQLRELNDTEVMARAEENEQRRLRQEQAEPQQREAPDVDEVVAGPPSGAEGQIAALVAEIPRSGDRWNQANFDLNTFRNFFGAEPGATHRIVLQHVDDLGELGNLESRPSVSVASHNYRFELEAASGLPYPPRGHPIGVFLQIAPRTFRYRLLLPRRPGYQAMRDFLTAHYTGPSNQMRRVVVTAADVRQAWPGSPLWSKPLQIVD